MTPPKERLIWALCSIMDGMKEHEIHEITGFPQETCEAIWSVYVQSVQTLDQHPKPKSLAEEALSALKEADEGLTESEWPSRSDAIHRALKRLQELEGQDQLTKESD